MHSFTKSATSGGSEVHARFAANPVSLAVTSASSMAVRTRCAASPSVSRNDAEAIDVEDAYDALLALMKMRALAQAVADALQDAFRIGELAAFDDVYEIGVGVIELDHREHERRLAAD